LWKKSVTTRSFTFSAKRSRYDLFHPRESLVWHDYIRSYAKRHWDDHGSASPVSRDSEKLDASSRDKVKRMLCGEPVEPFGLGPARTLEEYESYAGLSFQQHKVQDYTRRSLEPPNPPAAPDWEQEIYPWMVRVMIDPSQFPPAAFDKPSFWYVALHDENGREIYRRDFPGSELQSVTGSEAKIALVCELESGIIPVSWTVWPVSAAHGWLNKLRGTLAEDDYTIIRDDEI
jgi:hypothetical protein